jgi:hypothetical protein
MYTPSYCSLPNYKALQNALGNGGGWIKHFSPKYKLDVILFRNIFKGKEPSVYAARILGTEELQEFRVGVAAIAFSVQKSSRSSVSESRL